MVDLTLVNAKIFTRHGLLDGGVAIEDGKLVAIAKDHKLPQAATTLDLKGNLVLPGLIDVHTHLRDLAHAHKEDYYTGTCAALAGGFTTLLDMPNYTPLTNTAEHLRDKMRVLTGKSVANVGCYSCLPHDWAEFHRIKEAGAIGFKVFLHRPYTPLDVTSDEVLLHVFETIKRLDMILAIHAEDKRLIEEQEGLYRARADPSPAFHAKIHSPQAEIRAVTRVLHLMQQSNPRIHFCHISTWRASSMISAAHDRGLNVTHEVTPHHLLLSSNVVRRLGSIGFVEPPLRSPRTVKNVWNALTHGRIDVVASDHAPHTFQEKTDDDIWRVPSGFPGLETTLPVLWTMVQRGALSVSRLVEVLAHHPAQLFGLKSKGALQVGFDADLTVLDPKGEHVIDASTFYSKAKYSPFNGRRVIGKVVQVFRDGNLVLDDGVIRAQPGSGRILYGAIHR